MNKLKYNQQGIMLIPVIAGVLLLGATGTIAYGRVKHNELAKQQSDSSKSLQDSIDDSSKKKLALKEQQKKDDKPEEVKVPAPAEVQKPVPVSKPAPAPKPAPKPEQKTTTKTPSTAPSGSITLQYTGGKNVSWSVSGGQALYGFKLVWSSSSAPVYPGNNPTYYEANATSGSVNAPSGNHYVRVCMYHDGSCVNYSNELYINIP